MLQSTVSSDTSNPFRKLVDGPPIAVVNLAVSATASTSFSTVALMPAPMIFWPDFGSHPTLGLKQACVQRARLTSEFFPILAGEISPRLIEICSAGLKFVPAG